MKAVDPPLDRSEIAIDLGALRRNAATLVRALEGAELWAVVKADGYGHGATDVAGASLDGGARALCVATVPEGLALRSSFPEARILVLGPTAPEETAPAREGRLELAVSRLELPDGLPVHVELDTGMGRFGLSELPPPPAQVVGLMSHFATADTDARFAGVQLGRFLAAVSPYGHLTHHIANSAAALRLPEARLDAARCGLALYGVSPFGEPERDGLEPVLAWRSHLAQVRRLEPGESTGYGRRFRAESPAWIGLVPVGYADGFRRDLTGTSVLVADEPCPVVGTISMDSFAVELGREQPVGAPVVLIGPGVSVERHAEVARTIAYELLCGIETGPERARRTVVDGA